MTRPPTTDVTLQSFWVTFFELSRAFDIMEASNVSNYYYFPHVTKQDYDRAFNSARNEALKDPDLSTTSAARIYHVKEDSLRKSVLRSRRKERNASGLYNTHGGNNKILSDAQEEAIR
jgi:hypothetical protein